MPGSELDPGKDQGPGAPEPKGTDPQLLRIIRDHPHGILIVSSDSGQIVHSNPVARRLFRGDPDASIEGEVLGIPVIAGRSVLVEIGPPGWRRFRMSVDDVAWGGRLARFVTLRTPRAPGRSLRVEQGVDARVDDSRKARALLSHELRAPLSSILGSIYAARLDPSRLLDTLSLVEHQARRLGRLLEDLVDDGSQADRSLTIRPVPIPLSGIVEWGTEAVRPMIASRGQRLEIRLPDEPLLLIGDPAWIEQAFYHLLSNASKYSEPGGPILLEATRQEAEVIIRVRDEGIGIAPEDVDHIFEPFRRGESQGVQLREGHGIGLAMVNRIVRRHGGSISAFSPGIGLGSTFTMRLPLTAEAPRAVGPPAASSAPALARPNESALVVDDDDVSAESLALVLRLWGLEVRTRFDGPSALAEALALPPRILVIDRDLPGLDGEALAHRLRDSPSIAGSVLICLSGSDRPNRSPDDPFHHHLRKPVDFDALADIIASLPQIGPHRS
jgi:signal transduction histidine kinase